MNKAIKKVMIISATIFAGCSTIVSGKFQSVYVSTECNGQQVNLVCNLSNENGMWTVNTPNGTMIQKGFGDLTVNCAGGHVAKFSSSADGWTYVNGLWGGGGLLGALVDINNGSGYSYPQNVALRVQACPAYQDNQPRVNRWWRN